MFISGSTIKEMWFTYTVEYYSTIRQNGVQSFETTWTNLKDIMLSETSQTEQEKSYVLTHVCGNKKADLI